MKFSVRGDPDRAIQVLITKARMDKTRKLQANFLAPRRRRSLKPIKTTAVIANSSQNNQLEGKKLGNQRSQGQESGRSIRSRRRSSRKKTRLREGTLKGAKVAEVSDTLSNEPFHIKSRN